MTFVLRGCGCGDPTERRICEKCLARLNGQLDRFWGAA